MRRSCERRHVQVGFKAHKIVSFDLFLDFDFIARPLALDAGKQTPPPTATTARGGETL